MNRKHYILIVVLTLLALLLPQPVFADDDTKYTQSFRADLLETVVSIELIEKDGKGKPIGTGFLVQHPSSLVALVTAKHVIHDRNGNLIHNLGYRLNIKDQPSRLLPDDFAPHISSKWFVSESHDLALKFIAFFTDISDFKSIPLDFLLSHDRVLTGAPIMIAGFPLGKRSEDHAKPIVRKGIVALSGKKQLLLDGFTFPGNSGGPVFYVPTFKAGKGLKSPFINEERLIGLVSSQISYVEVAVSPHTGRPRVTFEDNAGLTDAVPADAISALLNRNDVSARIRKLRPDFAEKDGQQPPERDK